MEQANIMNTSWRCSRCPSEAEMTEKKPGHSLVMSQNKQMRTRGIRPSCIHQLSVLRTAVIRSRHHRRSVASDNFGKKTMIIFTFTYINGAKTQRIANQLYETEMLQIP
jgi:hypothetical protein